MGKKRVHLLLIGFIFSIGLPGVSLWANQSAVVLESKNALLNAQKQIDKLEAEHAEYFDKKFEEGAQRLNQNMDTFKEFDYKSQGEIEEEADQAVRAIWSSAVGQKEAFEKAYTQKRVDAEAKYHSDVAAAQAEYETTRKDIEETYRAKIGSLKKTYQTTLQEALDQRNAQLSQFKLQKTNSDYNNKIAYQDQVQQLQEQFDQKKITSTQYKQGINNAKKQYNVADNQADKKYEDDVYAAKVSYNNKEKAAKVAYEQAIKDADRVLNEGIVRVKGIVKTKKVDLEKKVEKDIANLKTQLYKDRAAYTPLINAEKSQKKAASNKIKEEKARLKKAAFDRQMNYPSPSLNKIQQEQFKQLVRIAKTWDGTLLEQIKKTIGAADIRNYHDNNRSILHYATAYGFLPLVEYLLSKGIPVNETDRANKTALDYAQERGYLDAPRNKKPELIAFLKSKNARSNSVDALELSTKIEKYKRLIEEQNKIRDVLLTMEATQGDNLIKRVQAKEEIERQIYQDLRRDYSTKKLKEIENKLDYNYDKERAQQVIEKEVDIVRRGFEETVQLMEYEHRRSKLELQLYGQTSFVDDEGKQRTFLAEKDYVAYKNNKINKLKKDLEAAINQAYAKFYKTKSDERAEYLKNQAEIAKGPDGKSFVREVKEKQKEIATKVDQQFTTVAEQEKQDLKNERIRLENEMKSKITERKKQFEKSKADLVARRAKLSKDLFNSQLKELELLVDRDVKGIELDYKIRINNIKRDTSRILKDFKQSFKEDKKSIDKVYDQSWDNVIQIVRGNIATLRSKFDIPEPEKNWFEKTFMSIYTGLTAPLRKTFWHAGSFKEWWGNNSGFMVQALTLGMPNPLSTYMPGISLFTGPGAMQNSIALSAIKEVLPEDVQRFSPVPLMNPLEMYVSMYGAAAVTASESKSAKDFFSRVGNMVKDSAESFAEDAAKNTALFVTSLIVNMLLDPMNFLAPGSGVALEALENIGEFMAREGVEAFLRAGSKVIVKEGLEATTAYATKKLAEEFAERSAKEVADSIVKASALITQETSESLTKKSAMRINSEIAQRAQQLLREATQNTAEAGVSKGSKEIIEQVGEEVVEEAVELFAKEIAEQAGRRAAYQNALADTIDPQDRALYDKLRSDLVARENSSIIKDTPLTPEEIHSRAKNLLEQSKRAKSLPKNSKPSALDPLDEFDDTLEKAFGEKVRSLDIKPEQIKNPDVKKALKKLKARKVNKEVIPEEELLAFQKMFNEKDYGAYEALQKSFVESKTSVKPVDNSPASPTLLAEKSVKPSNSLPNQTTLDNPSVGNNIDGPTSGGKKVETTTAPKEGPNTQTDPIKIGEKPPLAFLDEIPTAGQEMKLRNLQKQIDTLRKTKFEELITKYQVSDDLKKIYDLQTADDFIKNVDSIENLRNALIDQKLVDLAKKEGFTGKLSEFFETIDQQGENFSALTRYQKEVDDALDFFRQLGTNEKGESILKTKDDIASFIKKHNLPEDLNALFTEYQKVNSAINQSNPAPSKIASSEPVGQKKSLPQEKPLSWFERFKQKINPKKSSAQIAQNSDVKVFQNNADLILTKTEGGSIKVVMEEPLSVTGVVPTKADNPHAFAYNQELRKSPQISSKKALPEDRTIFFEKDRTLSSVEAATSATNPLDSSALRRLNQSTAEVGQEKFGLLVEQVRELAGLDRIGDFVTQLKSIDFEVLKAQFFEDDLYQKVRSLLKEDDFVKQMKVLGVDQSSIKAASKLELPDDILREHFKKIPEGLNFSGEIKAHLKNKKWKELEEALSGKGIGNNNQTLLQTFLEDNPPAKLVKELQTAQVQTDEALNTIVQHIKTSTNKDSKALRESLSGIAEQKATIVKHKSFKEIINENTDPTYREAVQRFTLGDQNYNTSKALEERFSTTTVTDVNKSNQTVTQALKNSTGEFESVGNPLTEVLPQSPEPKPVTDRPAQPPVKLPDRDDIRLGRAEGFGGVSRNDMKIPPKKLGQVGKDQVAGFKTMSEQPNNNVVRINDQSTRFEPVKSSGTPTTTDRKVHFGGRQEVPIGGSKEPPILGPFSEELNKLRPQKSIYAASDGSIYDPGVPKNESSKSFFTRVKDKFKNLFKDNSGKNLINGLSGEDAAKFTQLTEKLQDIKVRSIRNLLLQYGADPQSLPTIVLNGKPLSEQLFDLGLNVKIQKLIKTQLSNTPGQATIAQTVEEFINKASTEKFYKDLMEGLIKELEEDIVKYNAVFSFERRSTKEGIDFGFDENYLRGNSKLFEKMGIEESDVKFMLEEFNPKMKVLHEKQLANYKKNYSKQPTVRKKAETPDVKRPGVEPVNNGQTSTSLEKQPAQTPKQSVNNSTSAKPVTSEVPTVKPANVPEQAAKPAPIEVVTVKPVEASVKPAQQSLTLKGTTYDNILPSNGAVIKDHQEIIKTLGEVNTKLKTIEGWVNRDSLVGRNTVDQIMAGNGRKVFDGSGFKIDPLDPKALSKLSTETALIKDSSIKKVVDDLMPQLQKDVERLQILNKAEDIGAVLKAEQEVAQKLAKETAEAAQTKAAQEAAKLPQPIKIMTVEGKVRQLQNVVVVPGTLATDHPGMVSVLETIDGKIGKMQAAFIKTVGHSAAQKSSLLAAKINPLEPSAFEALDTIMTKELELLRINPQQQKQIFTTLSGLKDDLYILREAHQSPDINKFFADLAAKKAAQEAADKVAKELAETAAKQAAAKLPQPLVISGRPSQNLIVVTGALKDHQEIKNLLQRVQEHLEKVQGLTPELKIDVLDPQVLTKLDTDISTNLAKNSSTAAALQRHNAELVSQLKNDVTRIQQLNSLSSPDEITQFLVKEKEAADVAVKQAAQKAEKEAAELTAQKAAQEAASKAKDPVKVKEALKAEVETLTKQYGLKNVVVDVNNIDSLKQFQTRLIRERFETELVGLALDKQKVVNPTADEIQKAVSQYLDTITVRQFGTYVDMATRTAEGPPIFASFNKYLSDLGDSLDFIKTFRDEMFKFKESGNFKISDQVIKNFITPVK